MSQIQHVFGIGKEKSIQFWHSIIRQIYVKQLITKEIESYGVLKITSEGESFLKNPTSIKITEDHDYNAISDQKIISRNVRFVETEFPGVKRTPSDDRPISQRLPRREVVDENTKSIETEFGQPANNEVEVKTDPYPTVQEDITETQHTVLYPDTV